MICSDMLQCRKVLFLLVHFLVLVQWIFHNFRGPGNKPTNNNHVLGTLGKFQFLLSGNFLQPKSQGTFYNCQGSFYNCQGSSYNCQGTLYNHLFVLLSGKKVSVTRALLNNSTKISRVKSKKKVI